MGKSAASRAASLLGNRSEEDDDNNPGIFAMSVRLPSNIASLVSTMAVHAGCSRNEMANLIMEAGIDAILAATAPESVAEIHYESEANIADFIS